MERERKRSSSRSEPITKGLSAISASLAVVLVLDNLTLPLRSAPIAKHFGEGRSPLPSYEEETGVRFCRVKEARPKIILHYSSYGLRVGDLYRVCSYLGGPAS